MGEGRGTKAQWFARGLKRILEAHGHRFIERPEPNVRLVINVVDIDRPKPYRRKAQATFVVSVVEARGEPPDILSAAYPILVRSLANVLIYLVPQGGGVKAYFVTLELGRYPIVYDGGDEHAYFEQVYQRLAPLATSHLVIRNIFVPDLPPELWHGDEITRQLQWAGRQLDALNLLPAAFPIQEILSPRDYRHVQRLYGLGGLSYGNLSARRDGTSFWMSASGVNKGNLREIGRDLLLVKGYDARQEAIVLSVPPNVEPRRVSVDAIEHWMIYTEHREVQAIIHVHAWMDGVPSTEMNYPCGTVELASAVAELVRRAPDPSRAVIGLRNHGLTITGRSIPDIFERIEGKIIPQVPML
ncbi:MAG TPA: class II aldolase/adducin family protein [Chloroflexota bacterium]